MGVRGVGGNPLAGRGAAAPEAAASRPALSGSADGVSRPPLVGLAEGMRSIGPQLTGFREPPLINLARDAHSRMAPRGHCRGPCRWHRPARGRPAGRLGWLPARSHPCGWRPKRCAVLHGSHRIEEPRCRGCRRGPMAAARRAGPNLVSLTLPTGRWEFTWPHATPPPHLPPSRSESSSTKSPREPSKPRPHGHRQ